MPLTKKIIPGSGWNAYEWVAVITITIGVALVTVGITEWVKAGVQHGAFYLVLGALAVFAPVAASVYKKMSGKAVYEYPTATNGKLTKGDKVMLFFFVLAFALMIIGVGVALSSALLTMKFGWAFAEDFLWYGLLAAGAPMVLFFIICGFFIK